MSFLFFIIICPWTSALGILFICTAKYSGEQCRATMVLLYIIYHIKLLPAVYWSSFLSPLAVGQRTYVMVRCLSLHASVRRLCVRALIFSLNVFFSETTYRILMKFHRNVPAMVLFRIFERIWFFQKLWLPWQQNIKNFEIFKNLLVRNPKA